MDQSQVGITASQISKVMDLCAATQMEQVRRRNEGLPMENGGTLACFEGTAGCGKSYGVQAWCDEPSRTSKSGKRALLKKVTLASSLPEDAGSVYIPNPETKTMDEYTIGNLRGDYPEADDYDYVVVFIDELHNGNAECHAVIKDGVESRVFNNQPVTDKTIFVFAGNPSGTGCKTDKLDEALKDRLAIYRVIPDKDATVEHMIQTGHNPSLIGFISWKQFNSTEGPNSFAYLGSERGEDKGYSPRSLSKLSFVLDQNLSREDEIIHGQAQVGVKLYTEYRAYADLSGNVVSVQEILANPEDCDVPTDGKDYAKLYAVVTNCVAFVSKQGESLTVDQTDAITLYLDRVACANEAIGVFAFTMCKKSNEAFHVSEEHGKFLEKHGGI